MTDIPLTNADQCVRVATPMAAYAQHTLDIRAFVQGLTVPCYVSEVVPLTEDALLISNGRSKGGISGKRRSAHQEWLSRFNVEGPWHVR